MIRTVKKTLSGTADTVFSENVPVGIVRDIVGLVIKPVAAADTVIFGDYEFAVGSVSDSVVYGYGEKPLITLQPGENINASTSGGNAYVIIVAYEDKRVE